MAYKSTYSNRKPLLVSPIVNYRSTETGSLDVSVLNKFLPNKMEQSSAYIDVKQLAAEAEALKKEHDRLVRELQDLLKSDTESSTKSFTKQVLDFGNTMKQRDNEVNEFAKYILEPSRSKLPTFVQVEVNKEKTNSLDVVTSSLLVSNEQRQFFKAAYLKEQNSELNELLTNQDETMRLLKRRIQLYQNVQNKNTGTQRIKTLKNGQLPRVLIQSVPEHHQELDLKFKILHSQLNDLVKQRKALKNKQNRDKIRVHRNIMINKAATSIQKVYRGYVVRKYYGQYAIKIQKVFRGYLWRKKNPNWKNTISRAELQIDLSRSRSKLDEDDSISLPDSNEYDEDIEIEDEDEEDENADEEDNDYSESTDSDSD